MFDVRRINALAKAMSDTADEEASKPAIPKEFLKDTLVPSMGNRLAWKSRDLEERPDEVYVVFDLADVATINEGYGQDMGDKLIEVMGENLSRVAKPLEGEGYHLEGDKFILTFLEAPKAYEFLREMVDVVKGFPPIGMYGLVSFSAGLGTDLAVAERALALAKEAKVQRHGDAHAATGEWEAGHGRCYVYSTLGTPGLVPLDEEPEIPGDYASPTGSSEEGSEPGPMELRPEVEPDMEPDTAEEKRVSKSEAPDFARLVQVDAPSGRAYR